jgi:hypothetical protein
MHHPRQNEYQLRKNHVKQSDPMLKYRKHPSFSDSKKAPELLISAIFNV